jgi:glucokinase
MFEKLRMPKKITLGIDVGGTGIKMGLVERSGKLRRSLRFSTPSKSDPKEVAELIGVQARMLLKSKGFGTLLGVGVGAAGDVQRQTGIIRLSPNLRWKNVPLKKLLARHIDAPIVVENDANAAAWGAYIVESKRAVKNLACVTIGTGIGGGLIIDGKLYRGATGTAGEIGHATLYPEGHTCPCGNRGCLERYIGVRALSENARQAIASGASSLITSLVKGDLTKIEPLHIQKAARQGDLLARRLWRQAGESLGVGLASLVNVFNPEWIVLSGGLSRAGRLLLDPLKKTIRERSFPVPSRAVRLVISRLDQDLGIVGAGLLAFESQ